MTEKIVDIIVDTMKLSGKPAVICTVGGTFTTKIKQLFEDRMFPVYPSPERSAKGYVYAVEKENIAGRNRASDTIEITCIYPKCRYSSPLKVFTSSIR